MAKVYGKSNGNRYCSGKGNGKSNGNCNGNGLMIMEMPMIGNWYRNGNGNGESNGNSNKCWQ